MDYLSMLSVSLAELVLDALRPLLRLNMPFHDYVILVLRKAMFAKYDSRLFFFPFYSVAKSSRNTDGRMIALIGFLRLLKAQDDPWPLLYSTVSVSSLRQQQEQQMPVLVLSESLVSPSEIISNISRSLLHQYEVRARLYSSLSDLLNDTTLFALAQPTLELLMPQLQKYIGSSNPEAPAAPLLLDTCLSMAPSAAEGEDLVKPQEPLSLLLHVVLKALLVQQQLESSASAESSGGGGGGSSSSGGSGTAAAMIKTMRHLAVRLAACEPEEFDLDKNGEYVMASASGARNVFAASALLGCYAAMMDFALQQDSFSRDSCETAIALFKKMNLLRGLLASAASSKGFAAKGLQSLSFFSLSLSFM